MASKSIRNRKERTWKTIVLCTGVNRSLFSFMYSYDIPAAISVITSNRHTRFLFDETSEVVGGMERLCVCMGWGAASLVILARNGNESGRSQCEL